MAMYSKLIKDFTIFAVFTYLRQLILCKNVIKFYLTAALVVQYMTWNRVT
jgi:hypothetical protein